MNRVHFFNRTSAPARLGIIITAITALALSLTLSVPCLAGTAYKARAASSSNSIKNAPEQLSALETAISGQPSQGSIVKRIQQLELQVFSKTQRGSLHSRILALQKFAGTENVKATPAQEPRATQITKESNSDYMPPLPPYFDNGQEPVKQAPNATASHHTHQSRGAAHQSRGAAPKHANHLRETDSQLEQAIRLHQDGKVFEAESSLQQVLQKNPGNADACFSLGAIAEAKGDLTRALDYYTSAMQTNPSDDEARIAVAEISRKIKESHAASAQNVSGPFINPMAPPSERVLQGHALELGKNDPYAANAAFNSPPIGTLNVNNPSRTIPVAPVAPSNRSVVARSVARSLARAALGAALSQTGLHCPACSLLTRF